MEKKTNIGHAYALLWLFSRFIHDFIFFLSTWGVISGATAYYNAHFGRGSGHILLDNVACIGRESKLLDCPNYGGVGAFSSTCGHDDDAGVRCNGMPYAVSKTLCHAFCELIFQGHVVLYQL